MTAIFNFSTLTTEVRALLASESDSSFITTARVGNWLNLAQRAIAAENPGLRDLHVRDKVTWWAIEDQYEYDLTDFAASPVHTIKKLWYIDTYNTVYRLLLPPRGAKKIWDREAIPQQLGSATGYPTYYLRRGSTVELDYPPGATQNPLYETGGTATDANPSVVTKSGAFEDLSLAGKEVQLSGDNVTTGTYTIASNDDDTLTLTANCCSGGDGANMKIHLGGVLWLEYAKIPAVMSGSDNPTLTDFDLALIYKAVAIALRSPSLDKPRRADELEQMAAVEVARRKATERTLDRSQQNPDQGPT